MILATLQQLKDFIADRHNRNEKRKLYMEAKRLVQRRGHVDRITTHRILDDEERRERELQRAGGVAAIGKATHHRTGEQYYLLADGTKVLKDLQGNTKTIPPGI